MKKYQLLSDEYHLFTKGQIYQADYKATVETRPVGDIAEVFPRDWREVKVSKQDFRIVETAPDRFHVEMRVIETESSWFGFSTKEVVRWKPCDEKGNIYSKISCTRGYFYLHPVPPQKPFTSLGDAEKHIEAIIDLINNYPKIHTPKN